MKKCLEQHLLDKKRLKCLLLLSRARLLAPRPRLVRWETAIAQEAEFGRNQPLQGSSSSDLGIMFFFASASCLLLHYVAGMSEYKFSLTSRTILGAARKSFQYFSFSYSQTLSANIWVAQQLMNLYPFSLVSCLN